MKRSWTLRLAAGLCLTAGLCAAQGALADTARVTRGSIEKSVFGTGEIQPKRQIGVYAELDAQAQEALVGVGDTVHAGDVLMLLENDELAGEVEELEAELQPAQDEVLYTKTHTQYKYKQAKDSAGELRFDVNTGEPLMEKYSDEITIRAPSDGRIMAVYIEPGDDALAEYREHGSVAMLSTDGRMKVELTDVGDAQLDYEQEVVVSGEGFTVPGKVVSLTRRGTDAVIQVNSDDYPMDAPVTVTDLDGAVIGEGILEINKPMAVSAYGGTVKGLAWNVKVGSYLKRYDVIARIDWEETPLYYANSKVLHEYVKAKTSLEKARERQEQLVITAPCDGVIASVEVKDGDDVSSGKKVMSIVESGTDMELILRVDELDIPMVSPGQTAKLSVDALPDVELTGVVEKIAPLGNTDSDVTTYDVYIALDGETDERVRGGMNVSGQIAVLQMQDTLLIPSEALVRDGGSWTVQMESGERRTVEIGVMTDGQVEILSGLAEGETVVY